jgi:hypothetical protein
MLFCQQIQVGPDAVAQNGEGDDDVNDVVPGFEIQKSGEEKLKRDAQKRCIEYRKVV